MWRDAEGPPERVKYLLQLSAPVDTRTHGRATLVLPSAGHRVIPMRKGYIISALAVLAAAVMALTVLPAEDASAETHASLLNDDDGTTWVQIVFDEQPAATFTVSVYGQDGTQAASVEMPNVSGMTRYTFKLGTDLADPSAYTIAVSVGGQSYYSGSPSAAYWVDVAEAANGSAAVEDIAYYEGETVTVIAAPASGYVLQSLAFSTANGASVDVVQQSATKYTFTMPASDVTVTPVFGTDPTTYSTEVRASLVVDSDGVYLMMVAKDRNAIPDGTISITYSYTETVIFHGQERTRSNSDTFTQDYTSDGNAYAYVLLDFAGKAAENYDSVFGISAASFTYGETTVNAGSASFTLPVIERA